MYTFVLPLSLGIVLLAAGCQKPVSSSPTSSSTENTVSVSTSSTQTQPERATSSPMNTPATPFTFSGILPADTVKKNVVMKTNLGEMEIELRPDLGPRAASNFFTLAKRGFYDGTIFHRVIPGFMIQGGDPEGTGRGGPGYEFANDPVTVPYTDGMVAMANRGPDTNGSQFFIMVADYPLPPSYSIFGRVVRGLEVAHTIAQTERDPMDRPTKEVKMLSVTVRE